MYKKITSIGPRRIIGLIIGNLFLAMGVSLFKLSGMGNDPLSAMFLALSSVWNISYANVVLLLNTLMFIAELVFGRKYIGLGTFVNWFLTGYIAQFFLWISDAYVIPPQDFISRLPYLLVTVIMMSLGVSLYQTSDLGIAPYDSLALILNKHLPLPYFWCRIITDGLCTLICLFAGGLIGLGTLVSAFFLGPIIHFFTEHVSKKLIHNKSN